MAMATPHRLPLVRFLLSSAAACMVLVALTSTASAQGEHGGEDHGSPVIDSEGHVAVPGGENAQPDHGEATGHDTTAAGHDAHAGEHAAAGPIATPVEAVATAVTALIVFLVVLAVLAKMVAPKIIKGLADREAKFRDEIKAAENARIQAKEALVQYEKSLAEARTEAKQMLEDTRAQQAQYAADLKAKADQDLNAMKDKARRDIESARRAAVADIYNEASSLATKIAGKILQRELSPADHQRLVDESLAELQAMSRAN